MPILDDDLDTVRNLFEINFLGETVAFQLTMERLGADVI